MIRRVFILTGIWLLTALSAQGQDYLHPPVRWPSPSAHLYDEGMYGAFYHTAPDLMPLAHAYCRHFQRTRSLFFLRNRKFSYDARQLLTAYPEGAFRQETLLDLARFFFYHRQYDSAARYLRQVDAADFSQESLSSFLFMKGYTALQQGDSAEALRYFMQLAQGDNPYRQIARLLAGFILFQQGKYDAALPHFQAVSGDRKLGKVVPLFIAESLWYLRRFDDLISFATKVLEENTARQQEVIRLLLARALFFQGKQCNQLLRYLESLPQSYWTPFEYYMAGVCALESQDPRRALHALQNATFSDPMLRQTVEYLKGMVWAQQGQPARAHQAFMLAYSLDAGSDLTEHALYNAAIAAIESGKASAAFDLLKKFIGTYRHSPLRRRAIHLLSRLFMGSRDYPQALQYLKGLLASSRAFQDAFQQISYLYGRQLMEEDHRDAAISHFHDAIRVGGNDTIRAKAYYLLGEIFYRKGRYLEAIKQWRNFLYVRASRAVPYRTEAYYNLAYAELKGGTDKSALRYFRSYLQRHGYLQSIQRGEPVVHISNDRIADAIIRLADLYFKYRNWPRALQFYVAVAHTEHSLASYAWLQIARVYQIKGDSEKQVVSLQKALEKAPSQSSDAQEALLRLGEAYLNTGRFNMAIETLERFMQRYPRSPLLPQALEKLALAYYNSGKDDKALAVARRILRQFSGTEAAKGAASLAQNIYVERGRGEEYVRLLKKEAPSLLHQAAEDSILFESAFSWIRKNDCARAIPALEDYLKKFPRGVYAVKAHHYAAVCALESGDTARAVRHFRAVFQREPNRYSLTAVTWLARVYHMARQCDSVLRYAGILEEIAAEEALRTEARLMRFECYYQAGEWDRVARSALKLSNSGSMAPIRKDQVLYRRSEALLALGDTSEAIQLLDYLSRNASNRWGAEAALLLAMTHYQRGRTEQARQVIFDMPGRFPSYPEKVAEAYLLLGKILLESGDTVQARYTYESLMKNAPSPTIRNIARKKYEEITTP